MTNVIAFPTRRAPKIDPISQDILGGIWQDIEQSRFRNIEDAAKRDPERYKLSRVMPSGTSTAYIYYSGARTKRTRIKWCWAKHANVAGYFLSWKQTRTKRTIRRTQFKAWKKITSAQAWALSKAQEKAKAA